MNVILRGYCFTFHGLFWLGWVAVESKDENEIQSQLDYVTIGFRRDKVMQRVTKRVIKRRNDYG